MFVYARDCCARLVVRLSPLPLPSASVKICLLDFHKFRTDEDRENGPFQSIRLLFAVSDATTVPLRMTAVAGE